MRKRTASLGKYGISPKKYKELCGFCEQYTEWIEELKALDNAIKSPNYDGMPHSQTNVTSDTTASIAIKRAQISEKIELIESCAREADEEFAEHIIKSVCYEQPFWYIKDVCGAPISKSAFFERRRYFFYLLSQKR